MNRKTGRREEFSCLSKKTSRFPAFLFNLFLLFVACDQPAAPAPAPPATASAEKIVRADPAAEAKEIALNRCANCHGSAGKGDGPLAATLSPKPRDLSTTAWQKEVTDGYIRTIIVKGGAGMGKSVVMPANPDLAEKPDVVTELVKIVRRY